MSCLLEINERGGERLLEEADSRRRSSKASRREGRLVRDLMAIAPAGSLLLSVLLFPMPAGRAIGWEELELPGRIGEIWQGNSRIPEFPDLPCHHLVNRRYVVDAVEIRLPTPRDM